MKITFLEIEQWERPILASALKNHPLTFAEEILTSAFASHIPDTEILSTFIYSILDKEVLALFPDLKFIATRSTGFDHIDLEYCKSKNIIVSNVPTYGINTIVEHTFALMLALSRKLIPSVERTRHGNFDLEGLRGFELSGKTLGIVGFGHIGRQVAKVALAFGMKVLVFTHHSESQTNSPNKFVDLISLLSSSDIVSMHVPLTPDTKYLLNKNTIKKMKPGSMLINTSRGAIIETEAIVWALEQGILAGAGLDVLEEECVLKEERELLTKEYLKSCDLKTQHLNHVLLTREDVVVTPHNAFNSREALTEILDVTIENINAFLRHTPRNTV